ncbi:zinc finger protein GIS2-like [Gossypium raimondii]|nr:zinc finger protein GIS2-like [Gossypium raimondii]
MLLHPDSVPHLLPTLAVIAILMFKNGLGIPPIHYHLFRFLTSSSPTFARSRSLLGGKVFRSIGRVAYRDSPYSRDRRNNRHIAVECNSTTICWNCKEPGHLAGQCPYEPVCNMCCKMGHLARDCLNPRLPAHDARLCNNCYKAGHFVADCTNEKACNNCHKTGHLARDFHNEPVCNICNI